MDSITQDLLPSGLQLGLSSVGKCQEIGDWRKRPVRIFLLATPHFAWHDSDSGHVLPCSQLPLGFFLLWLQLSTSSGNVSSSPCLFLLLSSLDSPTCMVDSLILPTPLWRIPPLKISFRFPVECAVCFLPGSWLTQVETNYMPERHRNANKIV